MIKLIVCAAFFNLQKYKIDWDFHLKDLARGIDPFETLNRKHKLPFIPKFVQCVVTTKATTLTMFFTCPKCNFSDRYIVSLDDNKNIMCGSCHEIYSRG